MKKKALLFVTVTIVLFLTVFGIYFKYAKPNSYMLFVESLGHGVITTDNDSSVGTDQKYKIKCKVGETVTLNINPERSDNAYYDLKALFVNGENVTKDVNMLQYKVKADSKLSVVASFKRGKRPSGYNSNDSAFQAKKPNILKYGKNPYLGSFGAYDVSDPSVIYDEKSGYYYCFGSDNVVIKSRDLVNWTGRTTYFPSPEEASDNSIMTFSTFKSVASWGRQHGYGKDEAVSDSKYDRTPLAPDIIKIEDEYYLYFSISKIAQANESAIFCVKTDNLEKAISEKSWEDVGLVVSTCGKNFVPASTESAKETAYYDKANAVHPSVIDTENGLFMTYGGYYGKDKVSGEIYLLELSRKTGLLKEGSEYNDKGPKISTLHSEKTLNAGLLIAKPGRVPFGSRKEGSLIYASDIVYNEKTGFYYLFVTYGTKNTNAEIRVGRSKSISGPYLDYEGKSISDFSKSKKKNQYTKGTLFAGGYGFNYSGTGSVSYSDVGRASIESPNLIVTKNGNWFCAMQSQIYFNADGEILTGFEKASEKNINVEAYPCLDVREVIFSLDGWPLAVPEMYSGALGVKETAYKSFFGNWDIVIFDNHSSLSSRDEITRSTSEMLSVFKQSVVTKKDIISNQKVNLTSNIQRKNGYFIFTIDSVEYQVYPRIVWDFELGESSLIITGIGANGKTIWGKKNTSAAMGIYTDTFYYLLDKCDDDTKKLYEAKIQKISNNPSQTHINNMSTSIMNLLSKNEQ